MRFFLLLFFLPALLCAQENAYTEAMAALQAHRQAKQQEGRGQDIRFKNFSAQLPPLQHAFSRLSQLTSSYTTLPDATKAQLPSFREINALREGIAAEAADLLRKAPYAVSYRDLYQKPGYDDLSRRDTLYALRRALVVQCSDFLQHFAGTRPVPTILALRKTLLEEFMTLEALRQEGTGNGHRYEENCADILAAFDRQTELVHVLPQFYGAEFDPEREQNFQKLQQLARAFGTEPLDFLCQLNVYFGGATPENERHYDQFIRTFAPLPIAFVAVQKRAAPFLIRQDWMGAEAVFAQYQDLFPNRDMRHIRALLRHPPDDIALQDLGPRINTDADETHPLAAFDGLYFCRSQTGTGQDVYFAAAAAAGDPAPLPFNTSSHEVPQSISPEGETLILFGNYGLLPQYRVEMRAFNAELGKGDLYFVQRQGSRWTRLRPMPAPISTPAYEAGLHFSSDGQFVIFTSDRGSDQPKSPDNQLFFNGREDFNLDLWVAQKQADGSWGTPVNLGKTINTPFAESNPILHPDGKTLYFTSDGHPGLGGLDIFMARRLDTTSWTSWSQPINLGKSINTYADDGFTLDVDGQFAYVSLKAGDAQSYDLFRFRIPERFQGDSTQRTTWVKGTLTGIGASARVRFAHPHTGQAIAETRTDTQGRFRTRLPYGRRYVLTLPDPQDGFTSTTDFALRQHTPLTLTPVAVKTAQKLAEENAVMILENVFFDFDSDQLQGASYPELQRLTNFMQAHPDYKIRLEGHTDNQGSPSYNQQLSEKRARAVADHLKFLGLSAERVFFVGFGDTQPIAENATPEGRAQNRRVSFSIKKR